MRRQAGFTLLEVLVALVVFGFLMVGVMQGTRFGITAWRFQSDGSRRASELEAVDRTLRQLIAQAHPGTLDTPPAFAGAAGGLVFRTLLPQSGGGLAARAVDAAIGLDAQRRMVLRWSVHSAGGRRGAREDVLLAGLDHIELAYWRPAEGGDAAGWQRSWSGPVLPALVRVRLAFPPGDRRHWPDIVAAPMQVRPTE